MLNADSAQKKAGKYYSTGLPCPRGHIAKRYISTNECVKCQAQNDKRYKTSATGRKKNAEAAARHFHAHREQVLQARRAAWPSEKVRRIARAKALSQILLDEQENRSKLRSLDSLIDVPVDTLVFRSRPPWFTDQMHEMVRALYEKAFDLTVLTGIHHEVRYIIPLTEDSLIVCGLDVPWNMGIFKHP